MPRYQVPFVFKLSEHGFSESWYVDSGDTNLDRVRDLAITVAKKRMLLASGGCTMSAIRIANADLPGRVGKTYSDDPIEGKAEGPSMASNVAINCQFGTALNDYQKLVQVRGAPDAWESNGGQLDTANKELRAAFASWVGALIGTGFGWLSIGERTTFAVTGYVVSPAGAVSVVVESSAPGVSLLTAAGPIGTRNTLLFKRVNGRSRINGPQVCIVTGATTLSLSKPLALTDFVSPGIVEVPTKALRLVANGSLSRIGNLQAGAPLLLSPGRRAAQPRT